MPFETFDNLFDALADTLAESANMEARFEMLSTLQSQIRSWDLSEEAAAARLGITRARLRNLLRGKLSKFSLDGLIKLTVATNRCP